MQKIVETNKFELPSKKDGWNIKNERIFWNKQKDGINNDINFTFICNAKNPLNKITTKKWKHNYATT